MSARRRVLLRLLLLAGVLALVLLAVRFFPALVLLAG